MHATHHHPPRPPGYGRLVAGLAAWLALSSLSLTAQTAAEGTLNGRITDATSRSVLPGADISVEGSSAHVATTKDGEFSLKLPPGTYNLTVTYIGYPSKTVPITIVAGETATLPVALGDDVVQLEAFKVEGTREGQARALNQQRASQNLVSIISSDLTGQFPDKTIADAVKRLPGVTVETDTDTGGSEGRYITIRGMNADFNAVTINGIRANVSNFDGSSRRVPLDVVSAKSADQIEVTKALRPDQDGDGIGGAVNIVTRSPFERDGLYVFAEGSLGYSHLLDQYTGDFPYDNPSYELSGGFSTTFGKKNQFGIAISANYRDRTFMKQRVGTGGWGNDGSGYYPINASIQDFFDSVKATGLNSTLEWRPDTEHKLRLDLSFNDRETERGRQREVYSYFDGETGTLNGDTYNTYNSTSSRVERNVRQFFEDQRIVNLGLSGESKSGPWTVGYLGGLNHGTFDGDPKKDISARFRSASGTNTFAADGYTPALGSSIDENNPANFGLYRLDRGTSFVTDDNYTGGLDFKRESSLAGGDGFWKFGAKSSLLRREYEKRENYFFGTNTWKIDGYPGQVGSSVADYGSKSEVDGNYDLGFFIDPDRVRANANYLNSQSLLNPAGDNAARGKVQSYEADEDVHAGFFMGQFKWGKFTAMAGARAELTRVEFRGTNGATDAFGDYDPTTLTPYKENNDYIDVLPGLHLRYDQTKHLTYRFSVTRSIARPRLSDINPTKSIDTAGDIDPGGRSGIYVGDINLKPTSSTNFDLSAEYYFGNASTLYAGLFYKDMTDNIYTGRTVINAPGDPFDGYLLSQSRNADGAWVRGFELGYDQQLTFLPSPFDGLGIFANYTYADSEVDTGLTEYKSVTLPLFNQVKNTLSTGAFYEKYKVRVRAAVIYRSESLTGLDVNALTGDYDPKLSRYQGPTTSLDLTASYLFVKNWTVFTEFQNVLNTPGRGYDGTGRRVDYNEYTDWSANVGLRWSL